MTAVVACHGVGRQVAGTSLLADVTLDAHAGEVVAIIGPNGAGKSSLLRVLAGDVRADRGEVTWVGRDLASFRLAELAKVRAVVEQHASLTMPFNALEVVLLGRAPHVVGTESAHDVAVARSCLARVGLGAFAERLYTTLSGGEQQRVHVARAFAQIDAAGPGPPRALLLDEPTASLDLKHQHQILGAVRETARRGVAVIAILHDLGLAAEYADRIALLAGGTLRALGSPAEVLDEGLLAEAFGVMVRVLPAPWAPSRPLVVVCAGAPQGPKR